MFQKEVVYHRKGGASYKNVEISLYSCKKNAMIDIKTSIIDSPA